MAPDDPDGCDTAHALLRRAAAGVVRAGLSGPYGHVSLRLDDARLLVTPTKALSAIGPSDRGIVVPIRGDLPVGAAGEVRLHQRIYARRADIGGIVRFISPHVVALSAIGLVPRPRHGFGSYFAPAPAFAPGVQLIRNDALADVAIGRMGDSPALIMRGNGAIVAGADLPQALTLAVYLEDAARVELEALRCGTGGAPCLTDAEAAERATWAGAVAERMWEHLTD